LGDFTVWQNGIEIKTLILPVIVFGISVLAICLISGTEWTPSINSLIDKSANKQIAVTQREELLSKPAEPNQAP